MRAMKAECMVSQHRVPTYVLNDNIPTLACEDSVVQCQAQLFMAPWRGLVNLLKKEGTSSIALNVLARCPRHDVMQCNHV